MMRNTVFFSIVVCILIFAGSRDYYPYEEYGKASDSIAIILSLAKEAEDYGNYEEAVDRYELALMQVRNEIDAFNVSKQILKFADSGHCNDQKLLNKAKVIIDEQTKSVFAHMITFFR